MCGIAVILPGSAMQTVPFAIERMTDALTHRGPDAQAVKHLNGCDLGHTRLSVIDLSTGQQPMSDPTSQFTIVFNGEIFNYRDLRRELESLGHIFRTTSDTEVLLHACIEYGASAPTRLNGQFAFAFWNARDRSLLLARDRFGEKPLYWAKGTSGELIVASEIKAILASELVEPRIDLISVDAYLGLHYVPPDRTIYENVHTLPPAHVAQWVNGRCSTSRYWQPSIGTTHVNAPEAIEEIARLLDRAVQRQMTADVPVGAFLSGGLDSTTIIALMQQHSTSPVSTFSVGFGDLIDELPFAREAARQFSTNHHELQMNIDVAGMLHRMTQVYDEPFADSSNIPTYLIAEYAQQHVKVVLSGDGGDELFGGYDWYRPLLDLPGDTDAFHHHLRHSTHVTADRAVLWGGRQPQFAEQIFARYGTAIPPTPSLRYPEGSDSRAAIRSFGVPRTRRGTGSTVVRGIDAAVSFDCHCYLPGDILVKVDRAAMAHGLETRAPFLDVGLAEFVLGLPAEMRFGNTRPLTPSPGTPGEGWGGGLISTGGLLPNSAPTPTLPRSTGRGCDASTSPLKGLLRSACGHLWPESIRGRSKQGFGAPVRAWLELPAVKELWNAAQRPDGPLTALLPGLAEVATELRPQRKWTLLCLSQWLEARTPCLAGLR